MSAASTGSSAPVRLGRSNILTVAALVAILYFAQDFIVPVVLAALLSFLLDPINQWLERRGLRPTLAVITTTAISFLLIGVLIYVVTVQLLDLAQQLPKYKNNLVDKANSLKVSNEGPIGKAVETIKEVVSTLEEKPPKELMSQKERDEQKDKPLAVEVVPSTSDTMATARKVLGPILSPIGTITVVLLVAVFMMLGRDDLRDRIVHLMGRGRLRLTTHALDEASRRVSRYLLAQLIVNVSYGIPIGVGLYFIGIPNAMLWGMLAVVLRFLPYIGPWIAAAFPVALSIAVSNSWTAFLLTIGLFVVMELISNNLVEPWLYGAQTGMSPLAIVVSAIFWTWLWGISGLVLATPLTVCLVVMGKHVPQLRVLDLLLGDRPPITRGDRLYHRLLARDEDEALELIQDDAEKTSSVAAFDGIALRAVRLIETDFADGLLLEGKRDEALLQLREIVAELGDARGLDPGVKPAVLCIPASNLADEIAAEMLMEGLRMEGLAVECLSSKLTSGETVAKATEVAPAIAFVSVVSPTSLVAAAFICKQLRVALPNTRTMVGLFHEENDEYNRRSARLENLGAIRVLPTLERAVAAILELVPPERTNETAAETAGSENAEQPEESDAQPAKV
jgi:predicted PurR-regulated permease PerM